MSEDQGPDLFRQLLEAAPDAMVITDASGRIVLVNAQAKALFGYEGHELLGKTIEVLIPERFRHRHAALRQDYSAAPGVRLMGNDRVLRAMKKGGEEFLAEISLSPLEDTQKSLVLSAIRDVTRRERDGVSSSERLAVGYAPAGEMQKELARVRSELITSLEDVSRFSELVREPLARMLDSHTDLEGVAEAAQRLQRVVDEWVSYATLDHEVTVQPVSTSDLCDRAIERLSPLVEVTRAEVTRDDLPVVVGHPERITQLFYRLLENALDFRSERPPQVHVEAERAGPWWRFSVHDNGIGIASDVGDSVFRLFVRAGGEGDGVGLAMCRRIVAGRGGSIWYESDPGRGTTVFFTLPA